MDEGRSGEGIEDDVASREGGREVTLADHIHGGDGRQAGEGERQSATSAVPACDWPLQCCCNCSEAQPEVGMSAAIGGSSHGSSLEGWVAGQGGAGSGEGAGEARRGAEAMQWGAEAHTRREGGRNFAAGLSARLSLLRCGLGSSERDVRGSGGMDGPTAAGRGPRGTHVSEEECRELRAAQEGREGGALPSRYVAVHVKFDLQTAAGGSSMSMSSSSGGGDAMMECSYGGGEEEKAMLRAVRGSEGGRVAR